MASSLNDFAAFAPHAARMMKYRRTLKGGDGPETAIGSNVWRSFVFLPPTLFIPAAK